jgi:hypothetical protein
MPARHLNPAASVVGATLVGPRKSKYDHLTMLRSTASQRVLLVCALGVCVAHLWAVTEYQHDRLLSAPASGSEPALVEHSRYQGLVEARSSIVAANLALLVAVLATARSVKEGMALLAAGYSLAGLVAAAELAALGYRRITWPFLPLVSGEKPSLVALVYALALAATIVFYHAALRSSAASRRPPGSR